VITQLKQLTAKMVNSGAPNEGVALLGPAGLEQNRTEQASPIKARTVLAASSALPLAASVSCVRASSLGCLHATFFIRRH